MEDYKKKYEEALDNFKKIKAANKYNNELVDFIEYKYPELKENEDEKLRKECISIIDAWDKSCRLQGDYCEVAPKCIAWLEKQGEQKPIDLNTISIHKLVDVYRNTDEYDEDGNFKGKPINCMVRAYKQGITDILKTIKQKDVKPAWSEEDENIICFLINITEGYKIRNGFSSELEKGNKAIDWLKSLKERYTWKPSDEQMTYLSQVMDRNDYCGSVLYSLYQELKRL